MDLRLLLHQVQTGEVTTAEAERRLRLLPYEDIGFARLDHHRPLRKGFGEVIYAPGKTEAQLVASFRHFQDAGSNVLASRVSPAQAQAVQSQIAQTVYDLVSRTLCLCLHDIPQTGNVAVCTGGTADIPVAEEAAKVAEYFGCRVARYYDVGIAGIHRLFSSLEDIRQANAIAAVAGMEGALGSVIAGLVEVPVIAIPTSVGYGASFGGVSALLTALNACAEGLAVVNIDNGFGGGYLLAQINRLVEKRHAG